MTLGRTRYRGVGINRLRGEVAYANNLATARHVVLERDEGTVTADTLRYDLPHHDLRLENVRSTVDIAQTGVWLDPDVYHTIQPFHFHRPPTAVLNGNVQFNGGRNSHLVTDVERAGGHGLRVPQEDAALPERRGGRWCSPRTGCCSTTCARASSTARPRAV